MNLKLARSFILVGVLTYASTALAEVTVGEWLKDREDWMLYVAGIGAGISWANSALELNRQTPLYCPPNKLGLNAQNYATMIDKTIQNDRFVNQDTPLGMVLLGYQRTFPCPQAKK